MGTPPNNFCWEYVDSKDEYKKVSILLHWIFIKIWYLLIIRIIYVLLVILEKKINLINYIYAKYLGNVVEGNKVKYLNLPINDLKTLTIKSIDNNEAVWYGCDVGKWLHRDQCSMDQI